MYHLYFMPGGWAYVEAYGEETLVLGGLAGKGSSPEYTISLV